MAVATELNPTGKELHWVNILYLVLTPLAAVTLIPVYLSLHSINLWIIFFAWIYGTMSSMAITGGYHRFLAHRSYEAALPVKIMYLLIGAAAFQGSALQWCSDHRRHHRFVDTPQDPHNIRQGFFHAHMGWLCFKESKESAPPFPADLLNDPWIHFQYRFFVPIAVIMGLGFPMLVGCWMGDAIGGLLFGGVLRLVVTNHVTFCINSLAHTLGTRPYNSEETARDSLVMAVLAFGEGYHNFHHVFASDYRNGVKWYHWDPTKWVIGTLSLFGLTYQLKRISAAVILRARLQTDQDRLLSLGASAEYLQTLREKIEKAQRRWRVLREDYQARKSNMQRHSYERLQQLKRELKSARMEFKAAWEEWLTYRRIRRSVAFNPDRGFLFPS